MNQKEFFKPSISKIVLTLAISFIVFAFPRYGEYYGRTCPINEHCEPETGFVFFSGFSFIASLFWIVFYGILGIRAYYTGIFSLVLTIFSVGFFSYTLSCYIISTYNKFKNKSS